MGQPVANHHPLMAIFSFGISEKTDVSLRVNGLIVGADNYKPSRTLLVVNFRQMWRQFIQIPHGRIKEQAGQTQVFTQPIPNLATHRTPNNKFNLLLFNGRFQFFVNTIFFTVVDVQGNNIILYTPFLIPQFSFS